MQRWFGCSDLKLFWVHLCLHTMCFWFVYNAINQDGMVMPSVDSVCCYLHVISEELEKKHDSMLLVQLIWRTTSKICFIDDFKWVINALQQITAHLKCVYNWSLCFLLPWRYSADAGNGGWSQWKIAELSCHSPALIQSGMRAGKELERQNVTR